MEAVVKERPILFSSPMVRAILEGRKAQTRRVVKPVPGTDGFVMQLDVCPYGVPGDRLWVRETFWQRYRWDWCSIEDKDWLPENRWAYLTDHPERPKEEPYHWCKKPSIHMPRWASRITLEIEEVRVERLTEISDADARAEGYTDASAFLSGEWARPLVKENPWVWAITFKRVSGETSNVPAIAATSGSVTP